MIREKDIEKEMRAYLKSKGFITVKSNGVGFADIIAFGKINNEPTTIFIEVKRVNGKASKAQLKIMEKLKLMGFEHYYILRNVWDLKEILEG